MLTPGAPYETRWQMLMWSTVLQMPAVVVKEQPDAKSVGGASDRHNRSAAASDTVDDAEDAQAEAGTEGPAAGDAEGGGQGEGADRVDDGIVTNSGRTSPTSAASGAAVRV